MRPACWMLLAASFIPSVIAAQRASPVGCYALEIRGKAYPSSYSIWRMTYKLESTPITDSVARGGYLPEPGWKRLVRLPGKEAPARLAYLAWREQGDSLRLVEKNPGYIEQEITLARSKRSNTVS